MGWKATYECGCKENVKEANLLLLNISLLQVGKHVLKTYGGDANSLFNIVSTCKLAKAMQATKVRKCKLPKLLSGKYKTSAGGFPPDLYKKEQMHKDYGHSNKQTKAQTLLKPDLPKAFFYLVY